jgi:hypothetical protein
MADAKVIGMATFRKNVLKTVNIKQSKLALKFTAKKNHKTAISAAVVSVSRDVGEVMAKLRNYLLGLQMTQEAKQELKPAMGDLGADLVVLCRFLKVKTPTTTKKSKLVGTRTAALLQLGSLSTDMLATVGDALFAAPKMKTVKKLVNIPNGGKDVHKEERDVQVIDVDLEGKAEQEREERLRKLTAQMVDLYWKLCFDVYAQPPAALLLQKLERLVSEYPKTEFILTDPPKKTATPDKKAPAVAEGKKAKKTAAKKVEEPVGVSA